MLSRALSRIAVITALVFATPQVARIVAPHDVAQVLAPSAAAATSGMGNTLGNSLLGHIFRNSAYTLPANVYMLLGTGSAPTTDAGAQTAVASQEVGPSGTGYQRVVMAAGSSIFGAPALGVITNSAGAITFPSPSGNWCSGATYCTWFAVMDVQCTSGAVCANGNVLLWGTLTSQKNVNSGDAAPSFATNAVSFTLALLFPDNFGLQLAAANEPMVIRPLDVHVTEAGRRMLGAANEPMVLAASGI